MTKDEAEREAIRRWRELPPAGRKTLDHALDFAKVLLPELEFHTLGNRHRIIEAWLVRELKPGEAIARTFAKGATAPTPPKR